MKAGDTPHGSLLPNATSLEDFPPPVRECFLAITAAAGCDVGNFDAAMVEFFGLAEPATSAYMVTVRHLPTAVALTYETADESGWMDEFKSDLAAGSFRHSDLAPLTGSETKPGEGGRGERAKRQDEIDTFKAVLFTCLENEHLAWAQVRGRVPGSPDHDRAAWAHWVECFGEADLARARLQNEVFRSSAPGSA